MTDYHPKGRQIEVICLRVVLCSTAQHPECVTSRTGKNTYGISVTRLYDKALIDRIILALDEIRKDFHLSQISNDLQEEESNYGIAEAENN